MELKTTHVQLVEGGPHIPESLLHAHEEGRVVFFCGAGISSSHPARLPGFADLVKELRRLEINPNSVLDAAIRTKQYAVAVGILEKSIADGRKVVRQKIAEKLNPDTLSSDAVPNIHKDLLTLAKDRDGYTRLVTTNFDRLFENFIESDQSSLKRHKAPALPVPKQRWDGLVYLHGLLPKNPDDIINLDNLVVSSGDFGLAYLTERWAACFVSELFRNFIICFIGYSLDDPVLRYMTDALAADQLLGEVHHEIFAFVCYSKGKKDKCVDEWRSKNVIPIPYRAHKRHIYLRRTLQYWAETYRDGIRGKEHIVHRYANLDPDTATSQNDFVRHMMWALSDLSGLPAKRFAETKPVPSLSWLKFLSENCFGKDDLARFGVPPKEKLKENLAFSLIRRPASYDLAPQMTLANLGRQEVKLDGVMYQLTRWLTRHLNDPALLLWVARQGGGLHTEWANQITDHIAELEIDENHEKFDFTRGDAPNAVLDQRMQTLWGLLLSKHVKIPRPHFKWDKWVRRFLKEGMTVALRLELRDILRPCVSLHEPFRWPFLNNSRDEDSEHMHQLVDWNIILSTEHMHGGLSDLEGNDNWTVALPMLLDDFTGLLRDVLDLICELGGANERRDGSYIEWPSISEHSQNSPIHDWTALIKLTRDAWLATATISPDQAKHTVENWSRIPYPLFRRMVFFASAQPGIISPHQSLDWLLTDDGWWLWSIETRRETIRLLVALGLQLNKDELADLEHVILVGPSRDSRPDIKEEDWPRVRDRHIWLLLAKMDQTGTRLGDVAQNRLREISDRYPEWRLSEDEREEFPTWSGNLDELRTYVKTPTNQDELIQWLRENPKRIEWEKSDWRRRCQEDFESVSSALTKLALNNFWPVDRWSEALYVWAKDNLRKDSWRKMAPVLVDAPISILQEPNHALSWWLMKIAKVFVGQEDLFLRLCDRLLKVSYTLEEEAEDPIDISVGHPVANVTNALLYWWNQNDLEDGMGIPNKVKSRFTKLCNTREERFQYGRLSLATHLDTLFRVDPKWTKEFLLPLFRWENSEEEALFAWQGFSLSPTTLYPPLMELLMPMFLDTAKYYNWLGRYKIKYIFLLVSIGLESEVILQSSKTELAHAMSELPQDGLDLASRRVFDAVNSTGSQGSHYWRNRIDPYLNSVWPNRREAKSEAISENFARACIAARKAFPEALNLVSRWLQPISYPFRVVQPLCKSQLGERYPEDALRLLDHIIGEGFHGEILYLDQCLKAIRRTTKPSIENDTRFRRLREIVRKSGGDIT